MHGFYYLALINGQSGAILSEFQDLVLYKSHIKLNFLQILSDQGFDFLNLDHSQTTLDLKIQLKDSGKSFIYNFVYGENYLILAVTETPGQKAILLLERCIADFEFEQRLDNTVQEAQDSADFVLDNIQIQGIKDIFTRNLSDHLLPAFLIPEKEKEHDILSSENFDRYSGILDAIDGVWSIEDIADNIESDLFILQERMFELWNLGQVYFRFPYHSWDVFTQTIRAPIFLENGSEENLNLVNTFNSHRIITILQNISPESSYGDLMGKIELTETKLQKYLTKLIKVSAIQKKPVIPKFEPLKEDNIPLLSLQGMQKDEFKILSELEKVIDDHKTLDEISLEIHIEPQRIKDILNRYEKSIKIIQ